MVYEKLNANMFKNKYERYTFLEKYNIQIPSHEEIRNFKFYFN